MANYNFPPTSRYYTVGVDSTSDEAGNPLRFLQRRFLPQPERFAVLQEHSVSEGERIDHIAAKYLSDPAAFWRILDANGAMQVADLSSVGQKIKITLPEGIQGIPVTGSN